MMGLYLYFLKIYRLDSYYATFYLNLSFILDVRALCILLEKKRVGKILSVLK